MKKIKITQCRNKYHWYSHLVGKTMYVIDAKEKVPTAIDGYLLAFAQIVAPDAGFIYKQDTKTLAEYYRKGATLRRKFGTIKYHIQPNPLIRKFKK